MDKECNGVGWGVLGTETDGAVLHSMALRKCSSAISTHVYMVNYLGVLPSLRYTILTKACMHACNKTIMNSK